MPVAREISEYELERGKPLPSRNHGIVQFNLSLAFGPYAEKYSFIPELSLELDGEPLVPDMSVFPRLPVDWRNDQVKLTEPPLMVVEILSPTQALDQLVQKAGTYFGAGVRSCWIVEPVLETVVVLSPDEKPATYTGGEIVDPATGITVRVDEIFR
jgi:Uma2 family endonuclease